MSTFTASLSATTWCSTLASASMATCSPPTPGCRSTALAACVPPIIVGDISRPAPMTVKESKYAASVSKKPMKGMLTGPITCLRWSFPRDDVHQSVQAEQLALALRDEVVDLEKAGIDVIQVDEPALREGLPLRAGKEREKYLRWAVEALSCPPLVSRTCHADPLSLLLLRVPGLLPRHCRSRCRRALHREQQV